MQAFRALPRSWVWTFADAEAALGPSEQSDFREGRVTAVPGRRLLKSLGPVRLLVVTVRKADIADDVYYYRAEGQLLDAARDAPQQPFAGIGFARDRRDRLAWIIAANLALLALAYAAFVAAGAEAARGRRPAAPAGGAAGGLRRRTPPALCRCAAAGIDPGLAVRAGRGVLLAPLSGRARPRGRAAA